MGVNMRMFLLLTLVAFLFVFLYKQDEIEQFSSSGSTYAILVIAGIAVALLAGFLLIKGGNVFI